LIHAEFAVTVLLPLPHGKIYLRMENSQVYPILHAIAVAQPLGS